MSRVLKSSLVSVIMSYPRLFSGHRCFPFLISGRVLNMAMRPKKYIPYFTGVTEQLEFGRMISVAGRVFASWGAGF